MPTINIRRNNRQNNIGRNAKNGPFYRLSVYILRGGKKPSKIARSATGKNRGNGGAGFSLLMAASSHLEFPHFAAGLHGGAGFSLLLEFLQFTQGFHRLANPPLNLPSSVVHKCCTIAP
jgi:hypothetical protein